MDEDVLKQRSERAGQEARCNQRALDETLGTIAVNAGKSAIRLQLFSHPCLCVCVLDYLDLPSS